MYTGAAGKSTAPARDHGLGGAGRPCRSEDGGAVAHRHAQGTANFPNVVTHIPLGYDGGGQGCVFVNLQEESQ